MNILSYIHVHRLPNPSGVGRVIDRLLTSHARLYPEACHRMIVDRKLYDRYYSDLGDYWKTASFIPHKCSTSWQQAQWIWRNRPLAERFWDEVDIVYCPAESYVPTKRAKLVCTIHDVAGFEEDLYPMSRSRRLHCIKWSILFKKMAMHADAVVTVSNFSASRIARFFPELESKLHVIYNAPHQIFGADVAPSLGQDVDRLSEGHSFVLVPGGLSLRKNAQLIINAAPIFAKKLPGMKLIIAGSCEPHYADRMNAARLPNVVMPGYVSDELLNALYQRADAVWFPSRYEGFGMPVIEAMAAGAPVVSSQAASIPEVANGSALLCDKDDPVAHIEALQSIVESPHIRSGLAEKSREQARKFTWTASAQKLEGIFQSL